MTSEQQGTTIREFFTKLVKADDSAQKMMDANLARNKVRINEYGKLAKAGEQGIQLTSDAISKMAQEDATQAVNLMSELVGKNLLDMETLIKVFNGRYGLIVSNMLRTINGDIDNYVDKINESTNLTEDFDKQMGNLNNQWQLFKNRLFGANSEMFNVSKSLLNLIGLAGNGIFSVLNTELGRIAFSTVGFAGTIGMLSLGFANLLRILPTLTAEVAIFGTTLNIIPFVGVAAAIGTVIGLISHLVQKEQEARDSLIRLSKETATNTSKTELLKIQYKALADTVKSVNLDTMEFGFAKLGTTLSSMGTLTNEVTQAILELKKALDTPMSNAGDDMYNMSKEMMALDKQIAKISSTIEENKKKISSAKITGQQNTYTTSFGVTNTTYSSEVQKFIDDNKKLEKTLLELKNTKSKLDMAYQEENVNYINAQNEKNEAIILATEKKIQAWNSTIFGQIKELLSESNESTREGILNAISSRGGIFGSEFVSAIKEAEGIYGKTFSAEQLKDSNLMGMVYNLKDAYGILTRAQNEYNNSTNELEKKNINQDIIGANSLISLLKYRIANIDKIKSESSATLELSHQLT